MLDNIKVNLREHVNVVTLRSGKELNKPEAKKKNDEEKKVVEEELVKDKKPIEDKVVFERIYFLDSPPPYTPLVPYPHRFVKARLNKQFGKFL